VLVGTTITFIVGSAASLADNSTQARSERV